MNNLLESGILGNYTQCAVIEIFGIEKSKIFNIYTICTFEESKSVNEEKSYLTKRLYPFFNREDIKWGIIKRTLSIARVITEELPDAMQVADRFHLHQNLLEAIKKALNKEIPATITIPHADEDSCKKNRS